MMKAELIDAVVKKTEMTKKDAGRAIDAIFETIKEELSKGEKVQLVGFGSFEVRRREARVGRNPRTMEEIRIPARNVPTFRPGKDLKDAIH